MVLDSTNKVRSYDTSLIIAICKTFTPFWNSVLNTPCQILLINLPVKSSTIWDQPNFMQIMVWKLCLSKRTKPPDKMKHWPPSTLCNTVNFRPSLSKKLLLRALIGHLALFLNCFLWWHNKVLFVGTSVVERSVPRQN